MINSDATISFDQDPPGSLPVGWRAGVTGRGSPIWTVEADAAAPSKPNVLKQSGSGAFPWCVMPALWAKADSVTLFDDFSYGHATR